MTTKELTVLLKKHPFTTTCVGLSIILAGAYLFRQGGLPENEVLLSERTAESRRLKANIANTVSLKDHVAALEAANRTVDRRLMRAADLATNQQYFYKIESETGVKLLDLRPGGNPGSTKPAASALKHYSAVPYTCTVQGTYAQVLSFLRKLESGEHFPRILSAAVSISGGMTDDEAAIADPVLSLSIMVEFLGQS